MEQTENSIQIVGIGMNIPFLTNIININSFPYPSKAMICPWYKVVLDHGERQKGWNEVEVTLCTGGHD